MLLSFLFLGLLLIGVVLLSSGVHLSIVSLLSSGLQLNPSLML